MRARAARFLSGRARRHRRHDRFVAAQAAALELLADTGSRIGDLAKVAYDQVYREEIKAVPAVEAPSVLESLEEATFFSTLRRPEWAALRTELWPEPSAADRSVVSFRESDLRARLLAATARLGHGLIDLYLLTIGRLKTLQPRQLDSESGDSVSPSAERVLEYLTRLELQRTTPLSQRNWAAFDELQQVAANFALILDVNAPDARSAPLGDATRLFGTLLGQQQPVGGMFGEVNRTLVQQFRMPGYPFVLVTTDLLQEGEDLHTFCSAIQHYGISWTPSSMEQRTGRIDRVRSQTDRRLSALERQQSGEDLLQVLYPYLEDTVEILQVERVLERMNAFLRLMHEGLVSASAEEKRLDVRQVLARERHPVEVISQTLQTAFPIQPALLSGDTKDLEIAPSVAQSSIDRFKALQNGLSARFQVKWAFPDVEGQVMGTMTLQSGRIQPFTLFLDSLNGRPIVRCVSPVGVVDLDEMGQVIEEGVRPSSVRIGAMPGPEPGSYNLTVQEDVLLGNPAYDVARVEAMLGRVANQADQLEFVHLPGEDRPLVNFAEDLRREGVGPND